MVFVRFRPFLTRLMRNRFAQAQAPPRNRPCCRWRLCVALALTLACAVVVVAADNESSVLTTSSPSAVRIVDPTRPQVQLKRLRFVDVIAPTTFYEETELTLCRTRPQRFCRDLAKAEFEITSLHPLVPAVPGLTAKSITFRHNAVIANYTFR